MEQNMKDFALSWRGILIIVTSGGILINNRLIAETRLATTHVPIDDDVRYFTYSPHFRLQPTFNTTSRHNFIVYVMSAPSETDLREAARATWANLTNIRRFRRHGFNVLIMFVIGDVNLTTNSARSAILDEQRRHADLLSIADLKDSYGNLTSKTIYGMNYIAQNIRDIDFVFKVDSDNFINIFKYLELAWRYESSGGPVPDFICLRRPPTKVVRYGKYREPQYRYAPDTYPEYCSGPGYVASRDMLRRLVNASYQLPIMQSEDVMLTGVGLEGTGPVTVHNLTVKDAYFDHYYWRLTKMNWLRGNFSAHTYYIHQLPVRLWPDFYDGMLQYFL